MSKPTIFFSHSSRDKDFISALRRNILKATSKTIEVFQSSDGESIPFGNNWVHKIEENLNKAKIMLVFVSPQSVNSNWIHFESGFAYAKGVKVIPIGIKGTDVGKLSPPINLLQGFNISSDDGMNNIITVINREFNFEYEESFTADDYAKLSQHDENINSSVFSTVDFIQFNFAHSITANDGNETLIRISDKPLKAIDECLAELKIEFGYSSENKIHSPGMEITQFPGSFSASIDAVRLQMDPFRFSTSKDVIEGICKALYDKRLEKFWCRLYFDNSIKLETTDFKISSLLQRIGLSMSKSHAQLHVYKNLEFTPEQETTVLLGNAPLRNSLRVVFDATNFVPEVIWELISVLREANVIRQAVK